MIGESSMIKASYRLLVRELKLSYRHRQEVLNPLGFFVIVVTLFPLGISPDSEVLRTIAPGIIWVAALLASLLSLDTLFKGDFEDGTLEQLVLSEHPLPLLVLVKVFAHWLVSGLPIILFSPFLGASLQLPVEALQTLMITLLLGTPVLSLVGAIGMGLTVGLSKGGLLQSLLVLPLYIPVLIFAAGAVSGTMADLPIIGQIYILASILLLAISLAPIATSAALRISIG